MHNVSIAKLPSVMKQMASEPVTKSPIFKPFTGKKPKGKSIWDIQGFFELIWNIQGFLSYLGYSGFFKASLGYSGFFRLIWDIQGFLSLFGVFRIF